MGGPFSVRGRWNVWGRLCVGIMEKWRREVVGRLAGAENTAGVFLLRARFGIIGEAVVARAAGEVPGEADPWRRRRT